MREYFARRFMCGGARAVGYLAYGLATIADAIYLGHWDKAEAQVLLLLCALEQQALDRGRWGLAWLLTHLPEPPWAQYNVQPPMGPLRPFGRLSEPAWTAAAMAFMKDAAYMSELRKKGPAGGGGDFVPPGGANAKSAGEAKAGAEAAKGRGKRSQEGGAPAV